MIKLNPYEVCMYAENCKYRIDIHDGCEEILCRGCDPSRKNIFVCDFCNVEEINKLGKLDGVTRSRIIS